MLSILIPTYNYNIYNLVCELKKQCDDLEIEYEIISQDDASNAVVNSENDKINILKNCFFFINSENLGRGKNRNSLATKSKYQWLLFLDCDTFPNDKDFIKKYIEASKTNEIIFGGLQYQSNSPENSQLLRWIYGKKREALSVIIRNQKPYQTALTSNLFIKKELFLSNLFDENLVNYGYEDYLFFAHLQQKNIQIHHIDNTVIHLGLETSKQFLDKTKIATENLVQINQKHYSLVSNNRIIKAYSKLKFFRLCWLYRLLFKLLKSILEHNLVSKKPSLAVFDFYKLGCFCTAKKLEKTTTFYTLQK